jgi:hypothetical protein
MSLHFEGENTQTVDNELVFECQIYVSPILSLSLTAFRPVFGSWAPQF